MKFIAISTASITFLIAYFLGLDYLISVIFFIVFMGYGIIKSRRLSVNTLNDLPNSIRILFASLGGYLIAYNGSYIYPSAGVLLILLSLFLNDEFQRKTLDSILKGRPGGSIAFLGIDGSGKSSHASMTQKWFNEKGYRSVLIPFHKYLFVERLSRVRSNMHLSGNASRNPLRPLFSLIDNLLLQLFSSFGCRLEGKIVIFDRFIWSTYIKYLALGYPVSLISSLYLLPRPGLVIVLDVPVERSLKIIASRESHIRYSRKIIETERNLYLNIARKRGYLIIDSTKEFDVVQSQIEDYLSKSFPILESQK
jgi:dTMP kinase